MGNTQLLPAWVRATIPKLYSQDGLDAVIVVRLFDPCSQWEWFITEGQETGDDYLMFGYVVGFENEWGYVSLNELKAIRNRLGIGIERDILWKPVLSSEVVAQKEGR